MFRERLEIALAHAAVVQDNRLGPWLLALANKHRDLMVAMLEEVIGEVYDEDDDGALRRILSTTGRTRKPLPP